MPSYISKATSRTTAKQIRYSREYGNLKTLNKKPLFAVFAKTYYTFAVKLKHPKTYTAKKKEELREERKELPSYIWKK